MKKWFKGLIVMAVLATAVIPVGVGQATVSSDVQAQLNKYTAYLTDADKTALSAIQSQVQALSVANDSDLISEITNNTNIRTALDNQTLTRADLLRLFALVSTPFLEVDALDIRAEYQANLTTLRKLAVIAGRTQQQADALTAQDGLDYVLSVQDAYRAKVANANMLSILAAAQASGSLTGYAIDIALNNDNLNLATIIRDLGITRADLVSVARKVSNRVDGDLNAASIITVALVKSELVVTPQTATNNGKNRVWNYTIAGNNQLTETFIKWEDNSAAVTTSETSGDDGKVYFELASGTTATAAVTASINLTNSNNQYKTLVQAAIDAKPSLEPLIAKLNNKVIYTGTITMTDTSTGGSSSGGSSGGGGGGSVVIPTPTPTSTVINEAAQKELSNTTSAINKLAEEAKNATAEKKAELVAQAIAAAEATIAKIANLDVSKFSVVSGTTIVTVLDKAKVANEFAAIKEQVMALNKAIQAIDGSATAIKVKFTIDVTKGNTSDSMTTLAPDLLKAATEAGISVISIKGNSGALAFNPAAFNQDVSILMAVNPSGAAKGLMTGSKIVSYEINDASGVPILLADPVSLTIPVQTIDIKLIDNLSIYRINKDGSTTNVGGVYVDGTVTTFRMSLSDYVVVVNNVTFKDTKSVDAWAGKAINTLASKGIIAGRKDGIFDPAGKVTRAEFAKMLVKALGLEKPTAKQSFKDVATNAWYSPFIASAVEAGLIKGRTASEFDPNANITREEIAVLVARAATVHGTVKKVADADAKLKSFTDASDIASTLKAEVAIAVNEGLLKGSNNKFDAKAATTRAEAAVVISRLINR